MNRVDWLDLLRTIGALATGVIAFLALRNWQRQDKAKTEAEFLDALIDAVHAFTVEMGRPVALVETVRIGMRSQTSSWENDDESRAAAKGAIPYIKKDGERDSKRLFDALNEVRPTAIKLRSLGTKGQVFGFSGYSKCRDALALLVWQFDRIEALAGFISAPTLNWENPQVQRSLQGILTVEPKEIGKVMAESNLAVLNFVRETYRCLYGVHGLRR